MKNIIEGLIGLINIIFRVFFILQFVLKSD